MLGRSSCGLRTLITRLPIIRNVLPLHNNQQSSLLLDPLGVGVGLDLFQRSRSRTALSKDLCGQCCCGSKRKNSVTTRSRSCRIMSVSSNSNVKLWNKDEKQISTSKILSQSTTTPSTSKTMNSRLIHTTANSATHIPSLGPVILTNRDCDSQIVRTDTERTFSTVCIEGNIGCGKTTLLNYFQEFTDCEVNPEPVEKWRNINGHNALAMMYSDPSRWGMALQTYIQLTMLQMHKQPQVKSVRLMERSIYSAKFCFTDNLLESGLMPAFEHTILTKWYDWIIKTQDIQVDLIVYLRTDPVLLQQRIMKRCRKEEEGISLDLLKSLHQKHEDWLIHKKHPCPAEVLVIDANSSLEEMHNSYRQHKSKILVSDSQ